MFSFLLQQQQRLQQQVQQQQQQQQQAASTSHHGSLETFFPAPAADPFSGGPCAQAAATAATMASSDEQIFKKPLPVNKDVSCSAYYDEEFCSDQILIHMHIE